MPDVVIVGAGLSGLTAATRLVEDGAHVVVVDKGRGPGGRLATRRIRTDAGEATVDHGAQFFTVRSPELTRAMRGWPVHVWHHGPATARSILDDPSTAQEGGDGHPRYVGDRGMNGIAKHLAADLDVRTSVRVQSVRPVDGGWIIASEGSQVWSAPRVLVTAPVPQTIAMLPDTDLPGSVTSLTYDPCVALLAVLDRPIDLTAVQFGEGPVNHLADNASKGISALPAVTVHATGDWSRAHLDDDDATITDALTTMALPWLHGAAVTTSQVRRWRYATPLAPHAERAVEVAPGLVLAGDTFGGAKVEGALLSGLAAADLLV